METEIDYKEKYEKCEKFCRGLIDDISIFQSAIKLLKSELEKAKHDINERDLKIQKLIEMTTYLITENYVQIIPNETNLQNNTDEEACTGNTE